MISKKSLTILRIGLACAFLSQALVAYFHPDEFQGLVEGSFLVKVLHMVASSTFVTIILINDSLLAFILFIKPRFVKYALIWASIWMLGVMAVVAEPIDIIEHVAFLALSVGLYLEHNNLS